MSGVRKTFLIFGIVVLVAILILLTLIAVALAKAFTIQESSVEIEVQPLDKKLSDDDNLAHFARIFADSLKYKTVSTDKGKQSTDEFLHFHEFLRKNFPSIMSKDFITVETVNNYSLLFSVEGQNKALRPYMLAAHMDVVPVVAEEWLKEPFLGQIISDPISGEEVVWGRGAIDDKVGVIGILSAMEHMLLNNWRPLRSFYVAFGHDEEIGGQEGAAHIAELLRKRKVQLDFILDEGLPITVGVMQGIDNPVALIGVTEKGSMSIRINAKGTGGHSSIPPPDQAIASLSKAIHNLNQYPQPSMFGLGPEEEMLKHLAPKTNWPYKFVFANTWLFRPLIPYGFSKSRESNAMIRTTTAVTIVRSGTKDNVIPAKAWALINHRIHPAQTSDEVLQHDINAIDDPNIEFEVLDNFKEAHPISPYGENSLHYTLLTSVLKSIYPDVVSAPGFGVTSARGWQYSKLTEKIYRLLPVIVTTSKVGKYHGRDESLPLSDFFKAVRFFGAVIRTAESDSFIREPDSSNPPAKRRIKRSGEFLQEQLLEI